MKYGGGGGGIRLECEIWRGIRLAVGIKCLIYKTEKYVLSGPEVVSFMKKSLTLNSS